MPQSFKTDLDSLSVTVQYEYTPLRPGNYHNPEEGGADDIKVILEHPTDPTKNLDITDYLTQETTDAISERAFEDAMQVQESDEAARTDAAYDRERDRRLEEEAA